MVKDDIKSILGPNDNIAGIKSITCLFLFLPKVNIIVS